MLVPNIAKGNTMLRTRTKQHRATPLNLNRPWYGPDAAGEYLYGDAQKGAKRLEWLRMAGGGPKFAKGRPPMCTLQARVARRMARAKISNVDGRGKSRRPSFPLA
jgi:hypothetical protein